jgi:hypothetical protein
MSCMKSRFSQRAQDAYSRLSDFDATLTGILTWIILRKVRNEPDAVPSGTRRWAESFDLSNEGDIVFKL